MQLSQPLVFAGALLLAVSFMLLLMRPKSLKVGEPVPLESPAGAGLLGRLPKTTTSPVGTWVLGTGPDREVISVPFTEIMASHAEVSGATGTGKTELLKSVIDACGGWQGAVILDCTASPHLRAYAASKKYVDVWSFDGPLVYNPFAGTPAQVSSRLTEAEEWVKASEVYRAGAELSLARALAEIDAAGRPRSPAVIISTIENLRQKGTTLEGATGIKDRMASVALAGGLYLSSHGLVEQGLQLEDAVRNGRVVLFSLDCLTLPRAARRVGAWVILDVQRVASVLGGKWPFIFAVDEAAKLEETAAHLRTCVAQLRQFGCGTMIFAQGEGDLGVIGQGKARQILQSVGIRVALRQQSEEDQRVWSNRVLRRMEPHQFRQLKDLEGVLIQFTRRDPERIIRFRMQPRTAVSLRPGTSVSAATPQSLPWWRRLVLPAPQSAGVKLPDYLGDAVGRRLWQHTRQPCLPDEQACWESTYSPDSNGYPRISINHQDVGCHIYARAAYEKRQVSEIREMTSAGLTVDHKCANKLCWRPSHTQWKQRADHASLEWQRRQHPDMRVEGV